MEKIIEKFIIEFTVKGVEIGDGDGKGLVFTAGEALMLLDALRNEEMNLRQTADDASPLPIKITRSLS